MPDEQTVHGTHFKAKVIKAGGTLGYVECDVKDQDTSDHGALLRFVGQKKKAIQYLVGNPLFAIQMTQHDIRASLCAPLRVLIYENEEGKTCVEYDRPSSLFGQFGNERITPTATMLDHKLEALAATAIK